MRRRATLLLVTALVTGILAGGGPVAANAGCAAGEHPGGDWPMYGQNLSGTRSQAAETLIGPDSVATLEPKWNLGVTAKGGTGNFQSTPVISGGCMYAGTTTGHIFAVNADTGDLVWSAAPAEGSGIAGGLFSLAVADGRVFGFVSTSDGPVAVALDQYTGDLVWQTGVLEPSPGWTNASVIHFDGLLFLGISGSEGQADSRGAYAIVDAATGELLKKVYPIPDEDFAQGWGGAGVWATAVVDEATKTAYVGTSNPYGHKRDHYHANAILKIDLDRQSPRFGDILDAYKGDFDQYYPGAQVLADLPTCGPLPPTIDNPECGQIDVDFGASPNLFRNDSGRLLVGSLQKSGVYHVAFADTMQKAWTTIVAPPCALCNAASSATDGETVYVVGSPPSQLVALDADTGAYKWVMPVADVIHYEPVGVANGVVYVVTTDGRLATYDAETGMPLGVRSMSADVGDSCVPLSGSVAVARNKVYAPCDVGITGGGWIVTYGLPE